MVKKISWDCGVVGHRIRAARKRLRLTQEEAAAKADITAQYWSLIENGRYKGSVKTFLKIAGALEQTLNDLFYDKADGVSDQLLSSYEEQLSSLTEYERYIVTRAVTSTMDIVLEARKHAK